SRTGRSPRSWACRSAQSRTSSAAMAARGERSPARSPLRNERRPGGVEDRPALSTWSECTVTVPIRTESGLLAEWRQPSPETAVYRIYNAADELLYVGITNDLYVRWTDHKATKPWWRQEAHRY